MEAPPPPPIKKPDSPFTTPESMAGFVPSASDAIPMTAKRAAPKPKNHTKTMLIITLYTSIIIAGVMAYMSYEAANERAQILQNDAANREAAANTAPLLPEEEVVTDAPTTPNQNVPVAPGFVAEETEEAEAEADVSVQAEGTPQPTPPAPEPIVPTPPPATEVVAEPPAVEPEPEPEPVTVTVDDVELDVYGYEASTRSQTVAFGEQLAIGFSANVDAAAIAELDLDVKAQIEGSSIIYEIVNEALTPANEFLLIIMPRVPKADECTEDDPVYVTIQENLAAQNFPPEAADDVCAEVTDLRFDPGTYTYVATITDADGERVGTFKSEDFIVE